MIIDINKKQYHVLTNEFNKVIHNEYNNLIIREGLGLQERIISLLTELSKALDIETGLFVNPSHGGFIPINCSSQFKNVYILSNQNQNQNQNTNTSENTKNIETNILLHGVTNVSLTFNHSETKDYIVYAEKAEYIDTVIIEEFSPVILTTLSPKLLQLTTKQYNNILELTNTNLYLYIPKRLSKPFLKEFHYFITENTNTKDNKKLDYDNLINLCIMVKNGGPQFTDMLLKNLHLADRWTILDTGSTDDTINIINNVLTGVKKGCLYQEPFINFRDSRNRLLDLANQAGCKYNIMLDDTYVIEGDLRGFLNEVRGDQFADSFTLYIKSDDVEYGSNRVLKCDSNLKYKYKIHEVIQQENNMNVVIPSSRALIQDGRFDYMETRTMGRKELDLKLLYEELEDDPNNSRTHYYLAQTYNLLEKHEDAYKWFLERMNHPNPGFVQEKIDAIFEAARTANFKLNKPWTECEALYLKAYELDNSRPDALYFIGIHYHLENDKSKSFFYFKKAFEIGYPFHCQYSLKPTLSYHFLPKFLTQLCYEYNDFKLGEKCAQLFLEKNKPGTDYYDVITSWYQIFVNLNKMDIQTVHRSIININNKPLLCFVADGGFSPWTGSDILVKGVGGSETYIIEMARHIQKQGYYKVLVFCNTPNEHQTVFEDVDYIHISKFHNFVKLTKVDTCIISRFSEYIPVAIYGKTNNVYLVLHDLGPSGLVIPIHDKLKKVFCLSEWHVGYFIERFPQFKDITVPFYYGIDTNKFQIQIGEKEKEKVKNKFIYSSFPNRGLYELLKMWPKIVKQYPDASLHIYSDIHGKWVNSVYPDLMVKIQDLLNTYKTNNQLSLNIHYYGWVSKSELANAWITSEYWFYPCTFMETFCLTAVEAALSKTLAISNGLAALQNTVGTRGICIDGDAKTDEWQDKALNVLFDIMKNEEKNKQLIDDNYKWASQMSWSSQANKILKEYLLKKTVQSELETGLEYAGLEYAGLEYAGLEYAGLEYAGLEYAGMYNWAHDLPKGTNAKAKFEGVIQHFLATNITSSIKQILEVGTFAGTSLIEIVKRIPNSFGTGIDRWANYNEDNIDILLNIEKNKIEQIFYQNIVNSGMTDRIKDIKGDSSDVLLDLYKQGQIYDFIYVDGSHKCLDVFLDLMLSWKILKKGGILAIDDYMYHYDRVKLEPYEYPLEGVNHFLNKYKNEFTVLDKGYRVFLQKH
jgi:predicted O-methyltransferase YrrM